MAITSEIIGKLGGRVEATPVSGTASGGSGSEATLHTVEVPDGETWLVAIHGEMNPSNNTSNSSPYLVIGEHRMFNYNSSNGTSAALTVTGTTDVKLRRAVSLGSDSFTGHVYAVKM